MQPVLPRTTVLGPAAFASSFMICADWQPWHVRWPDVKYSSCGTFLTPLKASRFCVGFSSTKVLICMYPFRLWKRVEARYPRSPIHCVRGCALPFAAWNTMSVIDSTSGTVTSRPPNPPMKPITGGLVLLLLYMARSEEHTSELQSLRHL